MDFTPSFITQPYVSSYINHCINAIYASAEANSERTYFESDKLKIGVNTESLSIRPTYAIGWDNNVIGASVKLEYFFGGIFSPFLDEIHKAFGATNHINTSSDYAPFAYINEDIFIKSNKFYLSSPAVFFSRQINEYISIQHRISIPISYSNGLSNKNLLIYGTSLRNSRDNYESLVNFSIPVGNRVLMHGINAQPSISFVQYFKFSSSNTLGFEISSSPLNGAGSLSHPLIRLSYAINNISLQEDPAGTAPDVVIAFANLTNCK